MLFTDTLFHFSQNYLLYACFVLRSGSLCRTMVPCFGESVSVATWDSGLTPYHQSLGYMSVCQCCLVLWVISNGWPKRSEKDNENKYISIMEIRTRSVFFRKIYTELCMNYEFMTELSLKIRGNKIFVNK